MCFRDVADRDYIAARSAHRLGLHEPFLWGAAQAVEKYLKAILLFHAVPAERVGHNVKQALTLVQRIECLDLRWPEELPVFVHRLHLMGPNRYLENGYSVESGDLHRLDATVWHVRRYCLPVGVGSAASAESVARRVAAINRDLFDRHPERYRIPGGHLEEVIALKREDWKPARTALMWRNAYYSRTRLVQIRWRSESRNSPLLLHPEFYPHLKGLVQLPRAYAARSEELGYN
ncbi:MAG: hypothetical protein DHS20C21_03430 [Gemmatimonadota bacterium]|nr:MAG: hypothetical protein DHS20C21_03430 [Gemmatimonadota bacterium]